MKIQEPYSFCETGRRSNNEDSIFPEKGNANEHDKLFIVCDGIGGYEGGEIASSAVCKSLSSSLFGTEFFDKNMFQQALDAAYDELNQMCDRSIIGNRAGTTLTLLYLHKKGAFMAHIGDSRIYHLRKNGDKTEILYQSQDHSFVNDLVKLGMITPQQALTHPKRNIITRAMQPCQEQRDEAHIHETCDIKKGDCFFLCTDGVLEQLDNEKLCSIFNRDISVKEKSEIIAETCRNKSKDNFSAYIIVVDDVETK